MIWAALAGGVGVLAMFGMLYAARLDRRRHPAMLVALELDERLDAAIGAFARAQPWQPASDPEAPASAAAIEAELIAGDVRRALEAAEAAVAADPDSGAPRIWLAWALCAHAQPAAAITQLDEAVRRLGHAGPLATYLRARAEHLAFEHASGAAGAVPPLVTTGDLAIVTLARARGGPAWLTGSTERQLSSADIRAAIDEHREVTARCLARALDALDAAPGFADAAYLVCRLAIKAGTVARARAMFDVLGPRIAGRPDAEVFARDRIDLDDPERAVAAAKQKPVAGTGKRSISLKVLK